MILCNFACLDPMLTMSHCGVCGNACAGGQVCEDGICSAPTTSWETFGSNMQHTGENAAEMAKPPGTLAWTLALGSTLSPVVVAGGRFYVSGAAPGGHPTLWARNVSDGSPVWSYDFGSVFSAGHPTVSGGRVYAAHCNAGTTKLWVFDAVNGVPAWTAPMSAQWEYYWAPVVADGRVYSNGGSYGGLYGFDGVSGSQLFFNNTLEQYDEWSPAFGNGAIYSFVAGKLRSHDPVAGVVAWTTTVTWNWAGWTMRTAAVVGPNLIYVIAPPNLYAVDPATHVVAWTANGTHVGTPAVSGGLVYAVSGGNLIVRDAATGVLSWVFVGDAALKYPPVIAGGYVYVSSDNNVYAVEIATHLQAWTAPAGGFMSIANGRLFLSRTNGTLRAYKLSP